MDLVLDKQKTRGRRKSRLQERFDKLRGNLERQRRRSAQFRRDLDDLVEFYHRRSLENDKVVFDDLVVLSEKLIVFASRKSLSDWHRGDLSDWLGDLIERRISPIDRQVADRLRLDYHQAIARSMGISVDELSEYLETESEDFEREPGEPGAAEQPDDPGDSPWQEDLFGFEDVDLETEAFDAGADANGPDWLDDEADAEAEIGRAVMDGRWAKDLFRRAAQALHPDREPDPERRQVKHERMQELLRARRHGDIMAMLSIYGESVGGADIVIAEQEMAEICDALESQMETLELEKQEYIYSHPIRHLVFDIFYRGAKKGRKRRMQEWERDLRHEAADLRELVAFLRNLTCLKRVLEDRRDARAVAFADVLLDDIRF